jgi:hypothetical protein
MIDLARFIDFASGNAGKPYLGAFFTPDRTIAIPNRDRRADEYYSRRDNVKHREILGLSAE